MVRSLSSHRSWRCPDRLCGIDVDDMFAYSTNKMVKIRDARLGLLHYFMMFCIVMYIVVYQLIGLGGYLQKSTPTSTVRLSLQQPTRDPTSGKICNPNDQACDDNFADPATLPYCWQPGRTKLGRFATYNCTYVDGPEASLVKSDSIMMTTAVHEYLETRSKNCTTGLRASSSCRKLWNIDSDTVSNIVDPESFTLLVDHSLTSPSIESGQQQGFLYVGHGSALQERVCSTLDAVDAVWGGSPTNTAPCFVKPNSTGEGKDFFSVGLLLQSMGVSLDDASEAGSEKTKRSEGLLVNMVMEYTNFHAFHIGAEENVRYVYKLSVIPGNGFKESKIVSVTFPNKREKLDLHGVLFLVQAAGTITRFDFTSMLLQLTTSLALVAVATTIVNILAQYILQYSPFYLRAIYQSTHDFSDLRAANALTDEELEAQLNDRGLHTGGTKIDKILRILDVGWAPPAAAASFASCDESMRVSLQHRVAPRDGAEGV